MELLLALFDKKTNKGTDFNSNFKNLFKPWFCKRTVLNIIWGLINLSFLIFSANIMIAINLELLWLAFVIIYSFFYWILSSKLMDVLIGDEIDNGISK
tara:strand:+ start:1791 stop:2084 length:294 start_codon:yes stop_codon:yes gene_type:complete